MTISTDTTLLHDPRRQASLLYWQGFFRATDCRNAAGQAPDRAELEAARRLGRHRADFPALKAALRLG